MAETANETTETGGTAPTPPGAGPLALVAGFVALVHVLWWVLGDSVVSFGNLYDGDGYIRLVRIERLLETGQWFDSSLPRANWPYGGSLHWTRPLDVLLIALALPLAPVLGMGKALFWSGAAIGPVLHVLAAVALAWAARPLIGRAGALIAGGLTAVQFGVLGYAIVGHADHHVLIGLIAVIAFGFAVRALAAAEGGERHALGAGIALAAGYWAGMETQVTAGLILLIFGLKWLWEGDETGERALRLNTRLALGLAGGLAAAMLIERGPQGFFDPQYDRISIIQLTQAALVLSFWWAVSQARRRGWALAGWPGRTAAAAMGGAVTLALTWVLFPKFLVNPLQDFNPVILKVFENIFEYASVQDTSHFLIYMGITVIAGPWAAWRLKDEWSGPGRWPWILLALAAFVYAVFAFNWIRWSLYVGLFMAMPLADLIQRIDAAIDERLKFPARTALKVPVIILLVIGPLGIGVAGVYAQGKEAGTETEITIDTDPRPCPVQALSGFLNRPPWDGRPRTILASANFGAELLYRTPHRVTATLHHTNADGVYDSIRILGGADDAETRSLVRKREVDLILICRFSGYEMYVWKGGGGDTLFQRLKEGHPPGWLREIGLPGGLAKAFRLFQVSGR